MAQKSTSKQSGTSKRAKGKRATAPKPGETPVKSQKKSVKPLRPDLKRTWKATAIRVVNGLQKLSKHPKFSRIFVIFSLAVLGLTSVYWSVLSSLVQEGNADQFIDVYLFSSWRTFHGAFFPGAHTFLLKWPLFMLMRSYGFETFVFMAGTVLLSLLTVAALVYVMHKIERRPLVFGVLCLLLSSVLLLIPAEPYPGSLLPVNFAMTTARNIEYGLFLLSLYRSMLVGSVRTRAYWLITALMAILIASDKLFTVLILGSGLAIFALSVVFFKRRYDMPFVARLLLLGLVATGLADGILLALNGSGLTHILAEVSSSPYTVIHSLKQLELGLVYGVAGMATVMGANPVHGNVLIRLLPHDILHALLRPAIIAYAANGLVLIAGWAATVRILIVRSTDVGSRLTIALAGSTLAAIAVYMFTDHYYPVDARYLAVELFMIFVALATYARGRQFKLRHVMIMTVCILVVLPFSMTRVWQEYGQSRATTALQTHITRTMADLLGRNHIRRLIGDYWKVTPVKAWDPESLTVVPTTSCTQPRQGLTSSAWISQPNTTPTAVLAARDKPTADSFGGCSLAKLATMYGAPSQRIVLNSYDKPPYVASQLLLVYDHGVSPLMTKLPATPPPQPPAPLTVGGIGQTAECTGITLNVVAHEDDDLLFMNPDVYKDVHANRCVRTVYLTAGDAGVDAAYWHNREEGSKAAYAEMLGATNTWHEQHELLAGTYVTVASLSGHPEISLVFVRLPDGNLNGSGFPATRHESLHLLDTGIISSIHTVDDNTAITKDQLVDMLHTLIMVDAPDTVRTQGSTDYGDGDHSDHHAAGALTRLAEEHDPTGPTIHYYLGYPDKVRPVNLSDDEITVKQSAFLTYAKFDGAVCQTAFDCAQSYTYGRYLTRQYPLDDMTTQQPDKPTTRQVTQEPFGQP